jgi:hypothetical protein
VPNQLETIANNNAAIESRVPRWECYRRDHLRALAQRVEVDAKEVRISGSKSVLLRTLVAASIAKKAAFGVPSFVPKWRARRDSNSRPLPSEDCGSRAEAAIYAVL